MTERWISSKRHYCDVCNCWLSGHAVNISNHAKSEGHQINQQRRLREMHAKERQRKQEHYELSAEIRRIEAAGRQAFLQKDLKIVKGGSTTAFAACPERIGPIVEQPLKKPRIIEVPGQISAAPQFATSINELPYVDNVAVPNLISQSISSSNGHVSTSWIMSVNPTTNAPFYFNTITGETSDTDPSQDTPTPGGMFGRSAGPMSKRDTKEDTAMAAIASLLPSVNDMAEAFRAHVISSNQNLFSNESAVEQPNNVSTISTVAVSEPVAAVLSRLAEAREAKIPTCEGSRLTGDELKETSYIHAPNYTGTRPGYVFTTRDSFTGYYLDCPSLFKKDVSFPAQLLAEPAMLVVPQSKPIVKKITTAGTLGEWEEVSLEESKFGDCIKEKKDSLKSSSSVLTGGKLFQLEKAWCEEKPTVSSALTALKEEADANKALNDEDLTRRAKLIFTHSKQNLEQNTTIMKCESLPVTTFKKRIFKIKPTTMKNKLDIEH